MRVSVIDLGTNSIRFAVYELKSLKQPKRCIHKQKIMLRAGTGVFTSGRLQTAVMERILLAMKRFRRESNRRQSDFLEAYATSALREAENSQKLIHAVKKACGIQIRVISGEREAQLIARGILEGEKNFNGRMALIDIGGGSTEVTLCQNRRRISSVSLRLGSVRLQQLFFPESNRMSPERRSQQIALMRRFIRRQLARQEKALTKIHVHFAVGSSGSIRALAKVISKSVNFRYFLPVRLRREDERPHFSRAALSHFIELLTPLTLREIKRLPGLESRRSDLILPAAILLEEILMFLGIDNLQTTEFSLRDGLVLEVLDQLRL
jgi:exopolyphosphatase/guanosine-5'-triphosphate,3'-diphosphate pyrophosphatase